MKRSRLLVLFTIMLAASGLSLRAEDREEAPAVVLTVTDDAGHVVLRLTGPTSAGFQRVAWDLRYPPASIVERVQGIVAGHWSSTSAPTETHKRSYQIAGDSFAPVLEQLRTIVEVDMKALADRLEAIGAPWTPGRVPRWSPEK